MPGIERGGVELVHRSARLGLIAILVLSILSVPALATDGVSGAGSSQLLWATALAWLVPVGLGLVACGAVPPGHVARVIRLGWLALAVSVIGYWLCGFAFQFGGIGFVVDQPDLAGLVRQWTWAPIAASWGTQWGMLGLEGYMLRGPASTPAALALFLSQLPWITTAVALPLWSLQGRTRAVVLFMSGITIAFLYSLIGHWTWGGGWLANLGLNLGWGHGFVDWGGAGAVHLAGAATALAGMLAFGTRASARSRVEQLALPTVNVAQTGEGDVFRVAQDGETYVPMPPLHLPILATLGAWLVLVGWIGWGQSTPVRVASGLEMAWAEFGIGLMLAAAGGAAASLAFSWLTTGQANALMTARGVTAAIVAASAGLPFLPFWAALAVGAGAGLLVPLGQYAIEHVLRLDDPTSAIATHGLPALWGLLAVGLFADGGAGQAWNRVGRGAYLGVDGQGITGRLPAAGYANDWPGQFQAQLTGSIALCLSAFFASWLLFAVVQGLTRAWHGEYTVRLPRHPRLKQPRPRRRAYRGPRIRFVRASTSEPQASEEPTPSAGASLIRTLAERSKGWIQALRARIRRSSDRRQEQVAGETEGSAETHDGPL